MFKPSAILSLIEKIGLAISSAATLMIMVSTSFDVITRKFFDYSIPSLFELNEDYMMAALVFLSLSYVFVKGGHIRITLFLGRVPKAIRPVLDRVLGLCSLTLFFLIGYASWLRADRAFNFNETASNLLAYPLGPAFALVVIGVGLLSIRLIQFVISPRSLKMSYDDSEELVLK